MITDAQFMKNTVARDYGLFPVSSCGAERSFWVRVQDNQMEAAMPRLMPVLQSSPFLIIESNHILQYFPKDILIMVLR